MWVCRWEKGAVNPTRGKMGGATWTNRTGTIPPPLPFEGPPAVAAAGSKILLLLGAENSVKFMASPATCLIWRSATEGGK